MQDDEAVRVLGRRAGQAWRTNIVVFVAEAILGLLAIVGFAVLAFSDADRRPELDYPESRAGRRGRQDQTE